MLESGKIEPLTIFEVSKWYEENSDDDWVRGINGFILSNGSAIRILKEDGE